MASEIASNRFINICSIVTTLPKGTGALSIVAFVEIVVKVDLWDNLGLS